MEIFHSGRERGRGFAGLAGFQPLDQGFDFIAQAALGMVDRRLQMDQGIVVEQADLRLVRRRRLSGGFNRFFQPAEGQLQGAGQAHLGIAPQVAYLAPLLQAGLQTGVKERGFTGAGLAVEQDQRR